MAKTAVVTRDFTSSLLTSCFVHPWKGSKTGTECVSPTPAASWRLQRPIHKSSLLKTHSQQPQWVSTKGQKGAGKAQQISVSALQQDLTRPLQSGVMQSAWFSHLVLQHTLQQWAWCSGQPGHPHSSDAPSQTSKPCQEVLPPQSPRWCRLFQAEVAQLLTLAELGVGEVSAVVGGGGSCAVGGASWAGMAAGKCQAGAARAASAAMDAAVLLVALWQDERGGKIQNYLPKIEHELAWFCIINTPK